jgi:hypothetical protein
MEVIIATDNNMSTFILTPFWINGVSLIILHPYRRAMERRSYLEETLVDVNSPPCYFTLSIIELGKIYAHNLV